VRTSTVVVAGALGAVILLIVAFAIFVSLSL